MSDPEVWKTWEGRVVDGKFPLSQWLGGSEHSAVFLTERPGQASQKAAIKLIAADGAEADGQLARWRAAAKLSHAHLMRIFEAGRCRLDSTPLLYLVMEYAEEDLSQILPQRPLAPAEVTDLLPPVLEALSYLHGKGFVHGRIKPSNVLAMGDQLKLSTDQVVPSTEVDSTRRRRDAYDAPETAAGIITPAGDVWSVGVTLVAALTQNVTLAGEGSHSGPGLPETIPQPFRGIARECLHLDPKRRCSIAEIQARLQPAGRSVPAEPQAPPPVRRPRKRGHVAVGLLVAAALVALVVYFARGKNLTGPPAAATEQPAPQTAPAPAPNPPVAKPTAVPKKAAATGGEVVHQVLPDIPQSAKNTITGTIKINVRVEVDASGKVTAATLKSRGPSKYFAGLALKAAQQWEFSAPEVDGKPAASAWLLQFRLKRTSIQASSERLPR
ncbi:MAG: TonB family protein [Candidatus Sulfotelmatobacter sp.]